jgi:nucleotide-binding universal stress UspA family protein
MIKDILVHLRGDQTDAIVLNTAYAVARPFDAHLECVHILPDTPALLMAANAGSEVDPALVMGGLEMLWTEGKKRSEAARAAYSEFCAGNDIVPCEAPPGPNSISAAWREAKGDATDNLISLSRLHDLVVTAGSAEQSVMMYTHTGRLVMGAGKPIVLAPRVLQTSRIGTVAIAWKDSAEAARAITAAMPVLRKAHKIVVLSANEDGSKAKEFADGSESIANHLRWHGMNVEGRHVIPAGRAVPNAVIEAARHAGADMLVMGGYGHSRLRELIFGGFTRRVLEGVDLPVFIFH